MYQIEHTEERQLTSASPVTQSTSATKKNTSSHKGASTHEQTVHLNSSALPESEAAPLAEMEDGTLHKQRGGGRRTPLKRS